MSNPVSVGDDLVERLKPDWFSLIADLEAGKPCLAEAAAALRLANKDRSEAASQLAAARDDVAHWRDTAHEWNGRSMSQDEHIADLEAQLKAAREALEKIATDVPLVDPELDPMTSFGNGDDVFYDGYRQARYDLAVIARAALNPKAPS